MMVMDVSFGQAHSVIGDMKSLAAKHLNRMDPAAAIVEELVEASTRSQNGNIRFTYEFQICNIHLLYIYIYSGLLCGKGMGDLINMRGFLFQFRL